MNKPVNSVEKTIDYTVVKQAECAKLTTQAKGKLTYHIGTHKSSIAIRIVKNESGGHFSNEWVEWNDIARIMKALTKEKDKKFGSVQFKEIYKGKSTNNGGFLCAALRNEKVLIADPARQFLNSISKDWESWSKTVSTLKPVPTADLILPEKKPGKGRPKAKTEDETPKVTQPQGQSEAPAKSEEKAPSNNQAS